MATISGPIANRPRFSSSTVFLSAGKFAIVECENGLQLRMDLWLGQVYRGMPSATMILPAGSREQRDKGGMG